MRLLLHTAFAATDRLLTMRDAVERFKTLQPDDTAAPAAGYVEETYRNNYVRKWLVADKQLTVNKTSGAAWLEIA
jgi:hypothetical protein